MTHDQHETIQRLELIASFSAIIARDLRENPNQCWNLIMNINELKRQFGRVEEITKDINKLIA